MATTFRAHEHLWALFDGTAAHAPPGRLSYDGEGRVACHLCGRWFDHLGPHLRSHGWTAARYREAVGLTPGESLRRQETDGAAVRAAVRGQPRVWEVWQPQRRTARTSG